MQIICTYQEKNTPPKKKLNTAKNFINTYISYYNEDYVSVSYWNFVITDVTIPVVFFYLIFNNNFILISIFFINDSLNQIQTELDLPVIKTLRIL